MSTREQYQAMARDYAANGFPLDCRMDDELDRRDDQLAELERRARAHVTMTEELSEDHPYRIAADNAARAVGRVLDIFAPVVGGEAINGW